MDVVTGAGGFIGHHLVKYLKSLGREVRGVDLKYPEWEKSEADEFYISDLRWRDTADYAVSGAERVFNLAASMGGMGFITTEQAVIIRDNTLINMNVIEAARQAGIRRYFFSSSVCIYPVSRLSSTSPEPLREEDAYPADPQESYGWEKLHTEHLCREYQKAGWLETRIARFQNTFGPSGAWRGGREKAPAALCRKIAVAKLAGTRQVEVWGDGKQTRTFMYVDDCVRGIVKCIESDYPEPITLGPDRVITIDEMVDMIAKAAGIDAEKVYVAGPQGVRGRNFDHTRAREILGWEPQVTLEEGFAQTYAWVKERVREHLGE